MPRINEQVNTYSKGYLLAKNATSIPSDAQFVIGQAADGYKGVGFNDPGSYVFDTWSAQVQMAADAGINMGAQLTLRVAGNDFPIDYENPDADRQLHGFMYALTGRTYAFIVLRVVSADSDVMTVKAANFMGDQLRKRTGKRVFLQANEAMWKNSQHWDVSLGQESSPWSLLIIGDYETATGAAIETPGSWSVAKGLIWEQTPGVYRGWPPFASWYPSGAQPPVVPPVVVPPDDDDPPIVIPGTSDQIIAANTAEIRGLRQDLRKIYAGLGTL